MEVQNRDAISVRIVVGDRECLVLVVVFADVVPRDPFSRPGEGFPVAQVLAGLQGLGSMAYRAP